MALSFRRGGRPLGIVAAVVLGAACGQRPASGAPPRSLPLGESAGGDAAVLSAGDTAPDSTSFTDKPDGASLSGSAAEGDSDEAEEAPAEVLLCPTVFDAEVRERWFEVGGQDYWIDAEGRPARARAWLPPVVADDARDSACQTEVGRWGDATGLGDFDGGHLIAYQLGGWGARANLVPQEANFNRGNWAQLENALASCDELEERQLEVLVEVEYASADGLVPAAMVMTLTDTATGQSIALPFSNERGGGTDGTTLRLEGAAWLRALGCLPD